MTTSFHAVMFSPDSGEVFYDYYKPVFDLDLHDCKLKEILNSFVRGSKSRSLALKFEVIRKDKLIGLGYASELFGTDKVPSPASLTKYLGRK